MARVGAARGARIVAARAAVVAAACLVVHSVTSMAAVDRDPHAAPEAHFLTGQLLIAAPEMSDPRFKNSVIYMISHDEQGAFGLIINKVLGEESVAKLLFEGEAPVDPDGRTIRVHFGGPVDFGRGFVLHTPDYIGDHTLLVNDLFAMTPGEDAALLRALAKGEGPRNSILALGYAGWAPGQLESEINQEAWFTATTDEDFVFDEELHDKWERAYERRGFSL